MNAFALMNVLSIPTGLFTLAFGVTGYFLPMNVIPCGDYYGTTGGYWSTDVSTLPSEVVREWASSTEYDGPASFVYVIGQKANHTLFQGTAGEDYTQTLWSVSSASEPVNFPNISSPSGFVDLKNGWACFTAYGNERIIGCSEGTEVRSTAGSSEYAFQDPFNLIADNDSTLWFKDYPPWTGELSGTGTLVYSISAFETMEVALHSTFSTTNDASSTAESPEYEDSECWTKQNVMAIFVCAMPTAISSIVIWIVRTAPAMAITSYIGISALATFIYLASVGDPFLEFYNFWGWWLSVSAAFYIIALCDLTHCKRPIAQIPLIWGVNFGSLVFFIGMILLTRIYGYEERAWSWVVFNIAAIVPLAVIGLGCNQIFLLVLSVAGWLMTSVKIASALATTFSAATVPIYFIVLALSGMLIASLGWLLNKHQGRMHELFYAFMERISISRRYLHVREAQQEIDTGASAE